MSMSKPKIATFSHNIPTNTTSYIAWPVVLVAFNLMEVVGCVVLLPKFTSLSLSFNSRATWTGWLFGSFEICSLNRI